MSSRDIIQAAAGVGGGAAVNPNAYDFINYGEISARSAGETFNARTLVQHSTNFKDDIRTLGSTQIGTIAPFYIYTPPCFDSTGTKFLAWSYTSSYRHLMRGSLSTAWDLTTLSWDGYVDLSSYFISGDTTNARSMWTKDGQNIYIFSQTNAYHFQLATAWDVSSTVTTVYSDSYTNFSAQNSGTSTGTTQWNNGCWFIPDGSALVMSNGTYIYTWPLKSGGTAFDLNDYNFNGVSTGRLQLSTVSGMSSQSLASDMNICTNSDGTKWLLHSNSYIDSGRSVTLEVTDPTDLSSTITATHFVHNATYLASQESSSGTAGQRGYWPFRTTVDNANGRNFIAYHANTLTSGGKYYLYEAVVNGWGSNRDGGSNTTSEESVSAGSKGFAIADSGNRLYLNSQYEVAMQFDLSEPYELCTGADKDAWVGGYSISTQVGSTCSCILINDDGTKFYAHNESTHTLHQYTLSTAWDITTASYDSKSLTHGTYSYPDFCFSNDGSYLYATTYTDRKILRYSLSTAWDISTASLDTGQELFQSVITDRNDGVAINNAGTKIVISVRGSFFDFFTLNTPWDLTDYTHDGRLDFSDAYGNKDIRVPDGESPVIHQIQFDDTGERLYAHDFRSGGIFQITIAGS